MKKSSSNILRVGMAIAFLWIGVLILKNPVGWGSYMQPWAAKLLFFPLNQAMIATGILDVLIGIFLLVDTYVWMAGFIGALHILMVLVVTGVTNVTIRDVGLLAGVLALMVEDWPKFLMKKTTSPFKQKIPESAVHVAENK